MIEKIGWTVFVEGKDPTQHLIELKEKTNELVDAVNDLQAVVYEGPDDFMEDLDDDEDDCPVARAWVETDPFVERLHHLSTSQLEHLMEEAEWILEGRHRQGQEYVCPECQAQDEAEDDDEYDGCCHCNCDCHDLPDDDDEEVTWEVQQIVDKVRDISKKGSDLKNVDTSDGLFSQFASYVTKHPDQRFFQAIRNFSDYNFIFGSMAKDADDYSKLEDTFNLTRKGPKKGER